MRPAHSFRISVIVTNGWNGPEQTVGFSGGSDGKPSLAVSKRLESAIATFRAELSARYSVEQAGVIKDSAKAKASIFVVFLMPSQRC